MAGMRSLGLSRFAANLLQLKLTRLMVADELAQRWLVHFVQHIAEPFGLCATLGEVLVRKNRCRLWKFDSGEV